MSCQPNRSCSWATCNESLVKLFGWSCCHVFSPWMISCHRCSAMLVACNQSSSFSSAVVHVSSTEWSWHLFKCSLFSPSCLHVGHLSSICNSHLFMLVICGRKLAAVFEFHFCCATSRLWIAFLARSYSTIEAFPLLYCFALPSVLVLLCHWYP